MQHATPLSPPPVDGQGWHAPACPLYEVAEHDCAYDVLACTCGFEPKSDDAE